MKQHHKLQTITIGETEKKNKDANSPKLKYLTFTTLKIF